MKPAPHPLDSLPRLDRRDEQAKAHLRRDLGRGVLVEILRKILEPVQIELEIAAPEVLYRAAGLARPGVILQFALPERSTRAALALEPAIAHAFVDALMGFSRTEGQLKRQVTPVEWGLLAYLAARAIEQLVPRVDLLNAAGLLLDRVSPDPFLTEGLGSIVTLRFPVRIGTTKGAARLWLPQDLFEHVMADEVGFPQIENNAISPAIREMTSQWTAEAGFVPMPRGLARMKTGAILPIHKTRLRGTPKHLSGRVNMVLREATHRSVFEAEPGELVATITVASSIHRQNSIREPIAMSLPPDPNATQVPGPGASDLPVTLVVELGRVNLPVGRVADLKLGDVIELGKHAREPVELTSGGRLVARGELVQIDTELGVRVLSVFL